MESNNIKLDELYAVLDEYADIRDSLEEILMSFQYLKSEIEYGLTDITDDIDALDSRLCNCKQLIIK